MRYFKVTLLFGSAIALLVIALDQLRLFHPLDLSLTTFLDKIPPPKSTHPFQYPLLFLCSLGIAWTTIDIQRRTHQAFVVIAVLLQIFTAVWVFDLYNSFFSPFPLALTVIATFFTTLFFTHTPTGHRKHRLTELLGNRVSQKTFLSLLNSNLPLHLTGQPANISIVICEVVNLQELEATLSPENFVSITHSFQKNASDFLVLSGGYLDASDAQSVRVIFGSPLPDSTHPITASLAAWALAKHLDEVNRQCLSIWKRSFDFRIAIHSGKSVVSAYSTPLLSSLSISGEALEFTRHLVTANRTYGSRILLSNPTFDLAESSIETRSLDRFQRSPHSSPEEIYELLGPKNTLSPDALERLNLFRKAINATRETRWDDAAALFASAKNPHAPDLPTEFYLRRIAQLRQGIPALPPPSLSTPSAESFAR
ncbi:MAG: hypothetical protein NTX04_05465 [Verrucomicrobia bacterium]|nr:hypothetical protein [Verrucomicrobiota bacterium]